MTPGAAVAAVLAAGAVGCALGPMPQHGLRSRAAPRSTAAALPIGLVCGVLAAVLLLDGTGLALGLVLLAAASAVLALWRRARAQHRIEQRRAAVVELGEALIGELRAGRPAPAALERGSQVWPSFAPVAAAARLGADVPAALRRLGQQPGAEQLGDLASAWAVSERSGATLTIVLEQVVESARARAAAGGLVRAELASAQATARLVALLPVATLAMSAGVGADPWHFLLRSPAGLGCLAAGLTLVFTGLWWIDRIAAAVNRS